MTDLEGLGSVVLLRKPFRQGELSTKVREALGAEPVAGGSSSSAG